MKKCSHSKHETMTELNITPLLDLAFVLLVIFIITTTPIVNDLDLNLPKSSKHAKDPPRKATYITVNAGGAIWVNKREVADVASLAAMLTRIDTKSKLLGYPSVAIVCFLAAALAGVALILNSVLHDLPQRRRRH